MSYEYNKSTTRYVDAKLKFTAGVADCYLPALLVKSNYQLLRLQTYFIENNAYLDHLFTKCNH